MNTNEISGNRFSSVLKNEINRIPGKTVLLKQLLAAVEVSNQDLPTWLQSPEGWSVFAEAVRKLVEEQLIVPIGKTTGSRHDLYSKYRILPQAGAKEKQLLSSEIIRNIEPPARVDYYLKNPSDFMADREIIATIISFLRQRPKELLPTNERAYQLFGDEKFFKGDQKNRSRGATVLKRLGLDYPSIGCVETVEPFFSFSQKDFFVRNARRIYIIENKDTFWSFKKQLLDMSSRLRPDMLIYGEGRKILSSFKFVAEYDVNERSDSFFYFGDLDAEGINIFCELHAQYPNYRICPFAEGYQALLEIGSQRGIRKTPKAQTVKTENIAGFIQAFPSPVAIKLRQLLEAGFYIPQEALSAGQMKERFGKD